MIAAGYTTHLYCEGRPCLGGPYKGKQAFAEYCGRTWSHTKRMARRDGWTVRSQSDPCFCPECTRAKKKKPTEAEGA